MADRLLVTERIDASSVHCSRETFPAVDLAPTRGRRLDGSNRCSSPCARVPFRRRESRVVISSRAMT